MGNGLCVCDGGRRVPAFRKAPGSTAHPVVRDKKRAAASRRKTGTIGGTSPTPYPALFLQCSSSDVSNTQQPASVSTDSFPVLPRSTARTHAGARSQHDTNRDASHFSPSPSATEYSFAMLRPASQQTSPLASPKLSLCEADGLASEDSVSSDVEETLFVRTYDLFPRQWAYLEQYASAVRLQSAGGPASAAHITLPPDEKNVDPYGDFFNQLGNLKFMREGTVTRLLTPTQSFVWLELVNHILDEQELQERVDAARSIGQSTNSSKGSFLRQGPRPDAHETTLPNTEALKKNHCVSPSESKPPPQNASKPMASMRMRLATHGVPQPQPRLEDPRPDRATRRERVAAHRAARNYKAVCGYTLDDVATWVDSPTDLSLGA